MTINTNKMAKEVQRLNDRSLGKDHLDKLSHERDVFIDNISKQVSDENSNKDDIDKIIRVMEEWWDINHSKTMNMLYGVAAKNVVLDEDAWSEYLSSLSTEDEKSCDQAIADAFSHPLAVLFMESSVFDEDTTNDIITKMVVAYGMRFSGEPTTTIKIPSNPWSKEKTITVVSSTKLWSKEKTIFFQAMDTWRPTTPWKKELGRNVGLAKRSTDPLWSIVTSLLTKARQLCSQDLMPQIGILLSFDKVLDQVHQRYQLEHPSEHVELPRCLSADKLRELISGEE
jgi:hypothetical protein